jgi:shikimate dehydrogenase
MRRFGLIGFPLSHSFSKKYFTEKFKELGISDSNQYDLFEMSDINSLTKVIEETEGLTGLNVTIPHKLNVIPFLSEIDPAAEKIGAVNVIKVSAGKKLKGYNSDYYGFKRSLQEFVENIDGLKALVLGNGGAAKAVLVALDDLNISYKLVSRNPSGDAISYAEANGLLNEYKLIINCTPLGTYPNVYSSPEIDYEKLTSEHYLYDLVYNPEVTQFMAKGKTMGAKAISGYNMLVYQAEKSWEIWNL